MSNFVREIERRSPLYMRELFIDYEGLKKVITVSPTSQQSVDPFQHFFEHELEKVNLYAVLKHEDLFRGLQDAVGKARHCHHYDEQSDVHSHTLQHETSKRSVSEELDSLGQSIANLDFYLRHNYNGFMRCLEKYERLKGGSVWFVSRLSKQPFMNVNVEDLLMLLSLGWSFVRSTVDTQTWVPPQSFVRSTSKYWIKADQIVLLKTLIVRHLPLLVFGQCQDEQMKLVDPTLLPQQRQEYVVGPQLISSVYFDDEQADCYTSRIKRMEGSRLVRFRWYGRNDGRGDKEIFVERKVHHESWTQEESVKDRFSVNQSQIPSFLKYGFKCLDKQTRPNPLALEVSDMIQDLSLKPMVRTCYYRTAFQMSNSNAVRISLDTQFTLINEDKTGSSENAGENSWCRIASDILSQNDVTRFPFAILEIKLQDAFPPWVAATLEAVGAIRVHKFSKFLHGMAFLHSDKVTILPHWFPDFLPACNLEEGEDMGEDVTPDSDGEDDLFSAFKYANDNETNSLIIKPRQTSLHSKDMRVIEPKSLFANERTFIHYLLKCVYLMAFANIAGESRKWTNVVLYGGCIAYSVWCLLGFFSRQTTILKRLAIDKSVTRIDFPQGPVVLSVLVSGCLVALIADRMAHIIEPVTLSLI